MTACVLFEFSLFIIALHGLPPLIIGVTCFLPNFYFFFYCFAFVVNQVILTIDLGFLFVGTFSEGFCLHENYMLDLVFNFLFFSSCRENVAERSSTKRPSQR